MLERQIVGKGCEHTVYKSQHKDWVLKTPRWSVLLCGIILDKMPSQIIAGEFKKAQQVSKDTGVIFPETRVFPFGNGYIVAQKYIQEDHTVSDPEEYLLKTGNEDVINAYEIKPDNFIAHEGRLYWVDPTFGFTRIPHETGIISQRECNRLKLGALRLKEKVFSPKTQLRSLVYNKKYENN